RPWLGRPRRRHPARSAASPRRAPRQAGWAMPSSPSRSASPPPSGRGSGNLAMTVSWTNSGTHLIPFPVPGTTLTSTRGAYVIGQLIGDGQYGSVYECIGPFDQRYALKMLRPANKSYQAVRDEWSQEL